MNNFIDNKELIQSFNEVKDQFAPLMDLATSTSFMEGNKVAIGVLIGNGGVKRLIKKFSKNKENEAEKVEKSTRSLFESLKHIRLKEIGAKCKEIPGKVITGVSNRFKFAVLSAHCTIDLIASVINAVACSILFSTNVDVQVQKHWRHAGIALFTLANSSTLGIIHPEHASAIQTGFTVMVLGVHGNSLKNKIVQLFNAVLKSIKEIPNNINNLKVEQKTSNA